MPVVLIPGGRPKAWHAGISDPSQHAPTGLTCWCHLWSRVPSSFCLQSLPEPSLCSLSCVCVSLYMCVHLHVCLYIYVFYVCMDVCLLLV